MRLSKFCAPVSLYIQWCGRCLEPIAFTDKETSAEAVIIGVLQYLFLRKYNLSAQSKLRNSIILDYKRTARDGTLIWEIKCAIELTELLFGELLRIIWLERLSAILSSVNNPLRELLERRGRHAEAVLLRQLLTWVSSGKVGSAFTSLANVVSSTGNFH